MDNSPVDWEKEKRIKAEREKAAKAIQKESPSNLAYIDPRTFLVKKGFTRNPEAHRVMGEKISGVCLAVIIFGTILDAIFTFITVNLKMGMVDTIPAYIEGIAYSLLVLLPAFGSFVAVAEIIAYWCKTKKKMIVPLLNVVLTIVIFIAYQKIKELILITGF